MTKKLTKVAMTTALAAAAIVPAVVATPAQAAEAEVTFAKAYYSTANGTAAFEAGKLAGVISATTDTGITHLEASNGEVFTMQAFSAYLGVNPTATTDEVLTALSKAGKALSADQVKALNVKEGKVEGGKVTVDPTAVVKTALEEAIAKAEASPKAAELKDAIAAAKAVAENADATQAEVDAAVKALNEAIAKAEAATELKVESVKAINPTEIQVKFNQAVDSASARDLSNYILSLKGTKYDTATDVANQLQNSPAVQTSNVLHVTEFNVTTNTVTFKLANALANADKFSIDVKNGVLSADKQSKVAKYTDTTKTFTDSAAPKLLSTSINSDDKLELIFDEPVTSVGVVKIDDVTVYDPSGTPNTLPTYSKVTGKYSVVLNDVVAEELRAVGSHKVVAYDVKDAIAAPQTNTAAVATGNYTISTDVTPPSVSKVTQSKNDSRSFEVEFNEPVSYTTFAASVAANQASLVIKKGNYTFTLDATGAADASYKVTQKNAKTWEVTFAADGTSINPLYGKNEASANLSYELAGYKDAANNVGNKSTGNVALSKDMGAPAIKKGLENKINSSGNLVVKFDKTVTAVGTLDKSKVKVTDKDGISRSVTGVSINGTDELIITLDGIGSISAANEKAPFTVTLSPGLVKSAEDVQNTTGSVVISKDTTAAPVVAGVASATAASASVNGVNVNTITITYTPEMSASATDLSNYTLDGKALTGAKIAMDNANKVVTITLPEGFAKVDNQQLLEISKNVKTKDGSVIVKSEATKEAYTNLINLDDNTQPTLEKAEFLVGDVATSTQTKKIKLTFSEAIDTITSNPATIADLAVVIGGAEHGISTVANGSKNDKEVIIELAQDISVVNTVDVKVVGVTTENPAMDIKDAKGNVAKAGSARVSGKVLDTDSITNQASAQAAVDAAVQALSYDGTASTVTLPAGADSWASSDTATITDDGQTIVRPAYGASDKTVTFTASKTVNGQTATATKVLTVKAHTVDGTASTKTDGASNITTATGNTTFTVTLKDTDGNAITGKALVDFGFTSNAASSKLNITGGAETGTTGVYTFTATTTATGTESSTEVFTVVVDGVTLTAKPAVTIAIS